MGGPFGKQRLGTGPSSARPIWLVFLCFSMVGLGDRAPLRSAYAVLHVGSLPSCLAFAYANGHLERGQGHALTALTTWLREWTGSKHGVSHRSQQPALGGSSSQPTTMIRVMELGNGKHNP